MAMFEGVRVISCNVKNTAGVGGAVVNRFCKRQTSSPGVDEFITHVPGAAGAPAQGILAMKPDFVNVPDGLVVSGYVAPNGSEVQVELGEACGQGVYLRIGGNSTEVDGAAYLADASGDFIVGVSCKAGSVGDIIRMQFVNLGLLP